MASSIEDMLAFEMPTFALAFDKFVRRAPGLAAHLDRSLPTLGRARYIVGYDGDGGLFAVCEVDLGLGATTLIEGICYEPTPSGGVNWKQVMVKSEDGLFSDRQVVLAVAWALASGTIRGSLDDGILRVTDDEADRAYESKPVKLPTTPHDLGDAV